MKLSQCLPALPLFLAFTACTWAKQKSEPTITLLWPDSSSPTLKLGGTEMILKGTVLSDVGSPERREEYASLRHSGQQHRTQSSGVDQTFDRNRVKRIALVEREAIQQTPQIPANDRN